MDSERQPTRQRLTRRERLQEAWDQRTDLMEAEIVFHPFRGWFAEPMEARHFFDAGEYLGDNYDEAMASIKYWW